MVANSGFIVTWKKTLLQESKESKSVRTEKVF